MLFLSFCSIASSRGWEFPICCVCTRPQNLEPCLVHSSAQRTFVERSENEGIPREERFLTLLLTSAPPPEGAIREGSDQSLSHIRFLFCCSHLWMEATLFPKAIQVPQAPGPLLSPFTLPLAPHAPVTLASLTSGSSAAVPFASSCLRPFAHAVPPMHPRSSSLLLLLRETLTDVLPTHVGSSPQSPTRFCFMPLATICTWIICVFRRWLFPPRTGSVMKEIVTSVLSFAVFQYLVQCMTESRCLANTCGMNPLAEWITWAWK